ncbi:hypothetical protein RCL_jg10246.t1 [Rhizophagus clarus]|uniref:YTH domain-containing protein n=1 Tax=Rhizophagus clarus TaxID=94130 RepID=A0A8H3KVE6_9GLOM|nr:hypothetical protein RCL_jg10246.t1 [Rhizophagus clarus]
MRALQLGDPKIVIVKNSLDSLLAVDERRHDTIVHLAKTIPVRDLRNQVNHGGSFYHGSDGAVVNILVYTDDLDYFSRTFLEKSCGKDKVSEQEIDNLWESILQLDPDLNENFTRQFKHVKNMVNI